MPDDLPSLAALRAFSGVARRLSFKEAARDLHLSPSAVSRQIQGLERHLGIVLFRRLNPGLELTSEGRRYLDAAERALAQLEAAQGEIAGRRRPLRISALQSFTESWLMPNLSDFERTHPDVDLEIEATYHYADFARDPVDVAIRFGTGAWDGVHSEPLLDLEVYPVCSPSVAAGDPPLRQPADLAFQTLIHIAQTPDAWDEWLEAAGVPRIEPRRAVKYDHVAIALSAAESGQGVALSTDILCRRRLREGTLCRPLPQRFRSAATYHFVCRPERVAEPGISALRDWLTARLRSDAQRASADAE